MTNVFLSLGAIALLGSTLQRLFPDWNIEDFRKSISKLVLYILLPSLIFKVIYTSELGSVLYEVPLAMAAGILGCLLAAWLIFKCIPIDRKAKGSLILACAFGNVTYLGLPVLQGVFAAHALDISKVAILSEVNGGAAEPDRRFPAGHELQRGAGAEPAAESETGLAQLPPLWALAAALGCKFLYVPLPAFILHGTSVLGAVGVGADDIVAGDGAEIPAGQPPAADPDGERHQADPYRRSLFLAPPAPWR